MLNSVINWRAADQEASVARVARELGQLVVAGLVNPVANPAVKPVPARKRA
jgi:hypothetical protein